MLRFRPDPDRRAA